MALKKILIDIDGCELISEFNNDTSSVCLIMTDTEDSSIAFHFESDEDIDELIDQLTKLKQD